MFNALTELLSDNLLLHIVSQKRQDVYFLLCIGSELEFLWIRFLLLLILRHSVPSQLPQDLNIYTQGIFTEEE